MKSETDRAKAYCAALDDIRVRLDLVEAICRNHITTGTEHFDYEIVAINLRKVLEHIAFGSLTANRLAYESVHKDIQKIWRTKQLLERLEKIPSIFIHSRLSVLLFRKNPERRVIYTSKM
ncbi:MAG: hypothetical protein ACP5R6_06995 [Chlorobaculum sp.]